MVAMARWLQQGGCLEPMVHGPWRRLRRLFSDVCKRHIMVQWEQAVVVRGLVVVRSVGRRSLQAEVELRIVDSRFRCQWWRNATMTRTQA